MWKYRSGTDQRQAYTAVEEKGIGTVSSIKTVEFGTEIIMQRCIP